MPFTDRSRVTASPWRHLRGLLARWRRALCAVIVGGTAGTIGGLSGCSSIDAPQPGAASVGRGEGALPANWAQYRYRAAERLLATNPGMTYRAKPPEPMLAIPVLTIWLHADGSIERIEVMREPSQAHDTVQLAIDAVRRAAPFGSVTHLPRPWTFNEVFLFDDDRRFMPSSLDNF